MAFFISTHVLGQTTVTYGTAGSFSWICPAGVTSISVGCWGAGGGGGYGGTGNRDGGGGGGGGAYTRNATVTVIPGNTYTITVGANGAGGTSVTPDGGTGGQSTAIFGSTTVTANGGIGGKKWVSGGGAGGAGGTAGTWSGGNGANGTDDNSGGGGAGAGTSNNGAAASGITGGTGTNGGGNGGNGNSNNSGNGLAGSPPGGGGGGGTKNSDGGNGGTGQVTVTFTCSPVSGTINVGPSENFKSITSILSGLAPCGISGPVSLVLQSGYLSNIETFPITIPSTIPGVSATNTITIYPALTGLKITSNNTTGTLFFNGADYITIDGRVGATGSTRDLTIENTTTTGYSIYLNNGATYNTIKYCNVKGRNTTSGEGLLWFGSGTPGNSNNTIDNCDLGPDAGATPLVLIYSNASGGATNSTNTISNCLLHDFFVSGGSPSGINCNIGNTSWTITGNSFYQTASRATSTATGYDCIAIFSGDGYTISNNYIGGAAASCGGSALTITGGFNNTFYGIYFDNGLSTTNTCSIQGNVINNISFQTTPSFSGNLYFVGMHLRNGKINIGNVSGNTIGSTNGTGGITINISNAGSGTFYNSGIEYYAVSGLVQNNTIGSITINATAAGSGAINFDGIFSLNASQNAAITISGNTIGSSSTASSIQTTGGASVPVFMQGISFAPAGTGDINVSGNTIANILNNTTTTSSYIRGIECFGSTRTGIISNNVIRDLTSASASPNTDYTASLSGIVVINSGNQHAVSQNQIYNLKCTHTSADNSVNGIFCYFGTDLDRNLIYNLSLATSSKVGSSAVNGMQIDVAPDNATVKNNIIRLGFNSNGDAITLGTSFAGIWDLSGTNNYYNNSIYIGGSGAENTPINTACIYSEQSGTRTLRNNILCNERLGSSDQHFALILRNGTATSNYNCLYRPGGSDNSLVYRSPTLYRDLVQWQGAGFDANSISNEPGFIDEIGLTPNLHLRPSSGTCSDNGTSLATVTNDIDGETRSATPDIGADEYTLAGLVWNGNTSTAWNTTSNWTINTTPRKADVILIPAGRPRYPVITNAYDAGSYHTTIDPGASITVGPNAKLDITGTITNNAGVDGIVIQSTAAGTGSLLHSTALVNGTIQRYTTGSKDPLLKMYHCVSVPLDESNNSLSGLFYHSYLLYFDEITNTWIGMGAPTETPLDERKGYIIYFVFNTDTTYQFPGLMKAGSFTPLVTSHVTVPTDNIHGWNLVPNPYPSAIDWNAASGWTKTGIDNSLYIWNPALGTYAEYVGGSATNGGSRYIQVGQSFFIHANTTSPSFNMNNSVRLHNSTAFLKNTSDSPANELRLSIENNKGLTDEIIVKFNEYATNEFDNEWDAYDLPGLDEVPDLSTVLSDGLNLSINTLPFIFGTSVLPIHLSEKTDGQMHFSASGFESFVTIPQIYLVDNLLQRTIKLPEQSEYTFTFEQGQEDRFQLVFTDVTSYSDPEHNDWTIYKSFNKINMIIPEIDGFSALVSVYDITGRILSDATINFYGMSQIDAPKQSGVYIVKIVSGKQVYSRKIVIE